MVYSRGRMSRTEVGAPEPLPEPPRFRRVAADGHVAPAALSPAGSIDEDPAAGDAGAEARASLGEGAQQIQRSEREMVAPVVEPRDRDVEGEAHAAAPRLEASAPGRVLPAPLEEIEGAGGRRLLPDE